MEPLMAQKTRTALTLCLTLSLWVFEWWLFKESKRSCTWQWTARDTYTPRNISHLSANSKNPCLKIITWHIHRWCTVSSSQAEGGIWVWTKKERSWKETMWRRTSLQPTFCPNHWKWPCTRSHRCTISRSSPDLEAGPQPRAEVSPACWTEANPWATMNQRSQWGQNKGSVTEPYLQVLLNSSSSPSSQSSNLSVTFTKQTGRVRSSLCHQTLDPYLQPLMSTELVQKNAKHYQWTKSGRRTAQFSHDLTYTLGMTKPK